MPSIKAAIGERWESLAMYGALFAILGGMLWFKLGSLTNGYSGSEVTAYHASLGLRHIFEHPLNAPFHLITNGLTYLGEHTYILTRATSVILALGTLMLFCGLLHHWCGQRTAVFGTLLFGLSSWFLHTARLGTPDVLLFGLLALVACSVWLKRTGNPFVLLLCLVLAAGLLYIPGMIWFVVLGTIWQWKTLDRIFKKHIWAPLIGGILALAALAPLALALYKTPELAKISVGLPAGEWPLPLEVLENLARVPFALFAYSPTNPEHWLGHLPLLDVFSIAMMALGVYLYWRYRKLHRSKLIGGVLIIGTLLISLGGAVTMSLIVPFVYLVVAAGGGFMLDRWFRVFPRNPIAQGIGIGLMSLAVITAIGFHLRHYYMAWPDNSQTRAVFTIQPPTSDTIKE